jgi:acyl-CoA thioester hydrolase
MGAASLPARPVGDAEHGVPGCMTVRVTRRDIDRMGHVNNSVYLRWIEEAVHAHWAALATPEEFAAFLWIAVRHEIDYRRPAFAGDHLEVETRIVSIRRVRAWYETVIRRKAETLVEARSCWCCIDAGTRKLTAIPARTAERFLADRQDVGRQYARDGRQMRDLPGT